MQLRKQNEELSKKVVSLERENRIQSENLVQCQAKLKKKEDEVLHLRTNRNQQRLSQGPSGTQISASVPTVDEEINFTFIG